MEGNVSEEREIEGQHVMYTTNHLAATSCLHTPALVLLTVCALPELDFALQKHLVPKFHLSPIINQLNK